MPRILLAKFIVIFAKFILKNICEAVLCGLLYMAQPYGDWQLESGAFKVEAAHFGKETKSPRLDVSWEVTKVDVFICNKILLKAVCFP